MCVCGLETPYVLVCPCQGYSLPWLGCPWIVKALEECGDGSNYAMKKYPPVYGLHHLYMPLIVLVALSNRTWSAFVLLQKYHATTNCPVSYTLLLQSGMCKLVYQTFPIRVRKTDDGPCSFRQTRARWKLSRFR